MRGFPKNILAERRTFRFWINIWIALFLLSMLGVIDSFDTSVLCFSTPVKITLNIFTGIFKSTLLTALLYLSRRHKVPLVASAVIVAVYSLLCLVNGICYMLYGMGITIKLFTILAQTNPEEASEFLPSLTHNIAALFSQPSVISVIAAAILIFVCGRYIRPKAFLIFAAAGSAAGLASLIYITATLKGGRTGFYVLPKTAKCAIQTYREAKQVEQLMNFRGKLPYPQTIKSRELCDLIFITGESASRRHHSLYGYPLRTTPELDSMADSLIVFSDAIGSSTATAFNMNRILTFISDAEGASDWMDSPSIFSVMSHAGYSTAWISNQERSGTLSNNTLALVRDAEKVEFVGNTSSDDATIIEYDENLLAPAAEFWTQPDSPKLLGLHLMGSHLTYRRRYPQTFAYFTADSIRRHIPPKKARIIAEYDNSIRYTDHIVARIIKIAARSSRPAAVIYFSDHGENVYDNGDFNGRDERHVEVPFIIYLNRAFREAYPEKLAQLVQAKDLPLSTANLIHLILSLTGTGYQLCRDSLDISSPNYRIRPRYVDDHVWKYEKRR